MDDGGSSTRRRKTRQRPEEDDVEMKEDKQHPVTPPPGLNREASFAKAAPTSPMRGCDIDMEAGGGGGADEPTTFAAEPVTTYMLGGVGELASIGWRGCDSFIGEMRRLSTGSTPFICLGSTQPLPPTTSTTASAFGTTNNVVTSQAPPMTNNVTPLRMTSATNLDHQQRPLTPAPSPKAARSSPAPSPKAAQA